MQDKQLKYFLETARCESLNKAAEKLFISHQALSASIQALEKELGFPLFSRTKQGIYLTPKGERIFHDVEQVLDIFSSWEKIAEAEQNTITGDVYIAAPPAICTTIMTDIIIDCYREYPELNIHLYEGRDLELFDYIAKGVVSIVIDAYSGDIEKTLAYNVSLKHKLTLKEVFFDQYNVYLNTTNSLCDKDSLQTEDLHTLKLATYPNKEYYCPYLNIYDFFNTEKFFHIMHPDSIFQLIMSNPSIVAIYPRLMSIKNHYCKNNLIKPCTIKNIDLPVTNFILHQPVKKCTLAEKMIIYKIEEKFSLLNAAPTF